MYRTAKAAVLLVGIAIALASCGGGSGEGPATAAAGAGETVTATAGDDQAGTSPSGAGARAGREASAAEAGCQARLGDFLDRMKDLRQSLLAGLSYSGYVVRVRAIRAAYEAVPVDRLGAGCVTGPAADAEDAFNQYLRAANAWGDCAATAGCAASEVEAALQRRWHTASKSLDAAERQG